MTTKQFGWTFGITSFGWFLFALDRLVVVTALPQIGTDLGAGLSGMEWTVNAYSLAVVALLLTGAALGDRFGRRRMFVVGLAVFTAGSAGAAMAPTVAALAAARAIQGAGGAIFVPLAMTILSAASPPGPAGHGARPVGRYRRPRGGRRTVGRGWADHPGRLAVDLLAERADRDRADGARLGAAHGESWPACPT